MHVQITHTLQSSNLLINDACDRVKGNQTNHWWKKNSVFERGDPLTWRFLGFCRMKCRGVFLPPPPPSG